MATKTASTAGTDQKNFLFYVTLDGVNNPTFHAFHKAVNISFGWTSTHLYSFKFFGKSSSDDRLFGPRPILEISDEDEHEEIIMQRQLPGKVIKGSRFKNT